MKPWLTFRHFPEADGIGGGLAQATENVKKSLCKIQWRASYGKMAGTGYNPSDAKEVVCRLNS